MPEAPRLYGLSDIKNIWVPCSECGKEVAFPMDHGFDNPLVQHVRTSCPHCKSCGFDGTFTAIRRIVRLSEEPCLDVAGGKAKNQLSRIKIELSSTSADSAEA
jgi:hypothetical protein